ncbi:asparagine synthase-related protein [Halomarina rubra]|uniref:Asparagine synthase-related protein n=1 Tax=Halomarina rubra TaxID=2071873 RepID=A0ABD6AXE3_9EURY|nr:asparagine synthase-related protein [Halomarina rubra]
MPGTSLLHGEIPPGLNDTFGNLQFDDRYETEMLFELDGTVIAGTTYPAYPVKTYEFDNLFVVVEGALYDTEAPRTAIESLADALRERHHERVAQWVRARDGDFLITVADEHCGDVYILNDTFARLPTYYTTLGDLTVVSRELKLIRTLAQNMGVPVGLDRLGAAQQLLFGYCLGQRTVYNGISCIPPGGLVTLGEDGFNVKQVFQYDFGPTAHAGRDVETNARELASLFRTACERRHAPARTNVVSLSGGLDSRAVAGALSASDLDYATATFDNSQSGTSSDARVAKTVAEALDAPWTRYQTAATERHRTALFDSKQGMNYFGMAFIVDFFEQIRAHHGECRYITGDGGDKTLVDLTPPKPLSDKDALVKYIIAANSRFSLERAAAITTVSEAKLRESVADRIETYPERSLADLYAHFLVYERGFNFLNQGEDRNRYYFWSVSPFYSPAVFEYAINCPASQKHDRRLYRAFLEAFAPGLVDIEYPNFGGTITSLEYRVKERTFDVLSRYPALRGSLLDQRKVDPERNVEVLTLVNGHLADGPVTPLSRRAILDVTTNPGAFRRTELLYLLTMLAVQADIRARLDTEEIAPTLG